jgi:hypothetical protein
MKYFRDVRGNITCEFGRPYKAACGSCRVGEHSLDDVLPGDTLLDDGHACCSGCGSVLPDCTTFDDLKAGVHSQCPTTVAVRVATRFGMIDGEHHKQWVIDQMLRALLGPAGYERWVAGKNSDPDYADWDAGIAP